MVRKYTARRDRKKASMAGAKSIGNPCYKRRLDSKIEMDRARLFSPVKMKEFLPQSNREPVKSFNLNQDSTNSS